MELNVLDWMEKNSSGTLGVLILLYIGMFTMFLYKSWYSRSDIKPPFPPYASTPLPIIGNIHLVGEFPVRSLCKLARQQGPIFMLQLGCNRTVVISSATLAREILINYGHVLTKRPQAEFGRRMFYEQKSLLMMPYNSRWRSMRKICDEELFSVKKLQAFRHVREEEVRSMMAAIAKESELNGLINLRSHIYTFTSSVITRMVVSAKLSDDNNGGSMEVVPLRDMIRELGELIGVPVLSDFIPALAWLDAGRYKQRMDVLHKSFDAFLECLLHKRRDEMTKSKGSSPRDLVTAIISAADLDEDDMKAIVQDILGGGDTLALSIEWAMAEIVCRPATVLKKLKEELDAVVGRNCELVETDLPKLTYLRAVMKESFRLHPPAPVVFRQVPKQQNSSCILGGFRLPENAHVMINVWAIGRDPGTWANPEEFMPERFVGSDVDIRGANFEVIPFGGGRRRCPGMGLAIALQELVVANLVHSFDWRLPVGVSEEEVLRECRGVVALRKEKPLMLIATQKEKEGFLVM